MDSLPSHAGEESLGLISNKSCDNSEAARPKGGEVVSFYIMPLNPTRKVGLRGPYQPNRYGKGKGTGDR
jgi:hypothetical protein